MTPDPTTVAPDEVSPYDGLLDHDLPLEGQGDAHWAFGTDFEDPLAGVDTTVPDGVDPADLAAYCLMLGDDALVLSQRLAEWCSRGPDLEDDIALSNVALDLLGQARLLLSRAAAADPWVVPALPQGSPVPAEDALAFFRDDRGYRNVRLVEVDNGDFARTVVRLLLASTVRLALLTRLRGSRDPVLAAIAAKGVKELTYHRDWSARWVVTLAQGTDGVARPHGRRPRSGLAPPRRDAVVAPGGAAGGRRRWSGSTPPRSAPRSRPCSPRCSGRRGRAAPGAERRGGQRGSRGTRRLPHRGARPDAGRDAGRGARPPDGGVVMSADRDPALDLDSRPGGGGGGRPTPSCRC